MSESSKEKARHFIENETQFHLGFLPTEQSNPLTKNLDKEFEHSSVEGVRCLQRVDRNVLALCRRIFSSENYSRLVQSGIQTVTGGGRIVFSGCGATGRLSILLECMWRQACAENPEMASYADRVFSIMTGGDYALVKSVESFEDYAEFGRQQVRELNMTEADMIVAITEGGETSSVLGTVDEALNRGSQVFLLFNNPAQLLAERLERSRKAIQDPRVTVLDLYCGPMALAGSTRMQATTSEQLVAGAALETVMLYLIHGEVPDYADEFEKLLCGLEKNAQVIADYIEFEADVYRNKGKLTYFADDFLLDIFTDTTERSPTFMLPPFRKCDDTVSPQSWAFVKNPLHATQDAWTEKLHRAFRCLEWKTEDYVRMQAPESIQMNPPKIDNCELLKFQIGNENIQERCDSPADTAVLVTVGSPAYELKQAFGRISIKFAQTCTFTIGENGGESDFGIALSWKESPLHFIAHLAIKLVLNTVSTGIMVSLGRVTGNWMSWVALSNKKLMDRGIRLVSEIGNIDYETACMKLFEAIETIEENRHPEEEQPCVVQFVLKNCL